MFKSIQFFFIYLFCNFNVNNIFFFSLFRTLDKPEAIGLFLLLKQVLPIFLACTPELITRDNLQELCNTARKKPTWTSAHTAAYLGFLDCFKHDVIAKYTDS